MLVLTFVFILFKWLKSLISKQHINKYGIQVKSCLFIAQHSVTRSIPIITRHRGGVPLCPYSFVIVFFCSRILLL